MAHKTSRRKILKMFGYGVAGAGAGLFGTHQYGTRIETEWLQLEKIQVPLKQLGPALDGFKIVYMSDFHLYPNTRIELIQQAIDMANDLKPDLVALGGDFVLGTAGSIFELAPALARLNAKYGVFATLGNHDHWRGERIVRKGLEESGLPLLINSGITINVGRERIYLAGLDDGWVHRHDLSQALEKRPSGVTTILLMHEPDFADSFRDDERIDLQLSGHSHGGQVRFPFFGSPFCPPYGEKYDLGLYRVGNMWLYTSRGVGVTAPIRINCRPEVTEITLVS
ncbi:metallophosphoesterase [Acidobacteria bacterium AH-259-D05]|nr:metallophosphoesterase [Acidobacteria bacterium AH-259-D05]